MRYRHEGLSVGDVIRAYDFEAHDDCYVEGTVEEVVTHVHPGTAVPFAHYRILCDRDVHRGVTMITGSRAGEMVFVPLETSTDWDGRVTRIGSTSDPEPDGDETCYDPYAGSDAALERVSDDDFHGGNPDW